MHICTDNLLIQVEVISLKNFDVLSYHYGMFLVIFFINNVNNSDRKMSHITAKPPGGLSGHHPIDNPMPWPGERPCSGGPACSSRRCSSATKESEIKIMPCVLGCFFPR